MASPVRLHAVVSAPATLEALIEALKCISLARATQLPGTVAAEKQVAAARPDARVGGRGK